jgi:protein TonB
VPVPKPLPAPVPKSVQPPVPKPAPPKPPTPPLPQINLPPPPPPAPPAPMPPIPVPAPAPPTPVPPAPPPPAAVPPTPKVDNAQSEMNLELPPMPELAPLPLPLPPPPLPPAPARPPQRLAQRSARARSSALGGGLVMNGLSFSGGGSPSGGMTRGLNLDLPEAQQPGSQSDLSVQGDVGANWIAELQQWIDQRKYYPEMAGELNQQGTVLIRFTVDRAGHVSRLTMVSPTGYALLDEAWLGLFRGADLPPFPPGTKADTVTITASMRFEIIH